MGNDNKQGEENSNETGETLSEEPTKESDEKTVIDTTAYQAKIQSLNTNIAAKDAVIEQLNKQIIAQKAANYDLLTQVRSEQPTEEDTVLDIPDDDGIDIEDFFKIKGT